MRRQQTSFIYRMPYIADEEVLVHDMKDKEQAVEASLNARSSAYLFSFLNVFVWVVLPYMCNYIRLHRKFQLVAIDVTSTP